MSDVREWVAKHKWAIAKWATGIGLTGLAGGAFALIWLVSGPVAAMAYTIAFIVGMGLLPGAVMLLAGFGVGRGLLGSIHTGLAQMAAGTSYLVEHADHYQMAVGDRERVWLDGEYHDIEGRENLTIVGRQPFGILRAKSGDNGEPLTDIRADSRASVERRQTGGQTDGGQDARGGYQTARQPAVSGDDGEWLVDLRRVIDKGVRRIGDVGLLERAEEVVQRDGGESPSMGGWQPIVGALAGLCLGVATAFLLMGGL